MSNPIIYNQEQYQNIICTYNKALYAASPESLRPQIAEAVKKSCNLTQEELDALPKEEWTTDPNLPRTKWTIPQILDIIEDPWISWDMSDCNLIPLFLSDVFETTQPPSAFACNPVNDTTGFTTDQKSLIKAIGGLNHYLFARTYYIDRCYGTQQYLNFYYAGSEDAFIQDHILDFLDYVDNTGMIKGDKLLAAWRDNLFRASINVLDFIKPLAGLFCEDFWSWTNPNIYWWTEGAAWNSTWNDELVISDSWYNGSGNTIAINESKLITPLNENIFPGYRISVNDLYLNIDNPESDTLAELFGNNLLKGPTAISSIEDDYDPLCNIEFIWEDPTIEPTGIIPYTIDVITDVSISGSYLSVQYDKIDTFDVPALTTSTINVCTECNNEGILSSEIVEDEEIDFDIGAPQCFKTIDVITDIFIEDLNLRVTKSTIKIISITSVNNDTNIIGISACDNSTYTSNPVSYTISECDSSLYDNFDYIMPTGISCVTDIYFENNYLKQRKCTITVPNKLSINSETINLIPINNNCNQ